jgi:hypothetical protein
MHAVPDIGVTCCDVALLAATGTHTGVRTWTNPPRVELPFLQEIVSCPPEDVFGDARKIRIDLLEKKGTKPFFNGNNHLIWRDGEAIDPFVLAILRDAGVTGAKPEVVWQREVFNGGKSFRELSPLQRYFSARGSLAAGPFATEFPAWGLPTELRSVGCDPGSGRSYIARRAAALAHELVRVLSDEKTPHDQQWLDEIVSLAERARAVAFPPYPYKTLRWLMLMASYAHTVSGELVTPKSSDDFLLQSLTRRFSLPLFIASDMDRSTPNTRWLARYWMSIMDTDALAYRTAVEVFIPLQVGVPQQPLKLNWQRTFPARVREELLNFTCQFRNPFWDQYYVRDGLRTVTLPDGKRLTERLVSQEPNGYLYAIEIPNGGRIDAEFGLTDARGCPKSREHRAMPVIVSACFLRMSNGR